MRKKLALIYISQFIIVMLCNAQPGNFFFQNYNTTNGLCNNYVNAIEQDSRGFIWLGTNEGLSRFDGISFRNYYAGRDKKNGLPAKSLSRIFEYKPGQLLLLGNHKVGCMNTIGNQFYQVPGILSNQNILDLQMTSDSLFVFSTTDTIYITKKDLLPWRKIATRSIAAVVNNITAMGASEGNILLTNFKKHWLYHIASGSISSLPIETNFREEEDYTIFTGYDLKRKSYFFKNYWHGLYEFDERGKQLSHYECIRNNIATLSDNSVNDMLPYSDSILLTGTGYGFNIVNSATGKCIRIFHDDNDPNSIIGNTIIESYKDRDGNIWIGTNKGVSKLSGQVMANGAVEFFGNVPHSSECNFLLKGPDNMIYANYYPGGTIQLNISSKSMTVIDTSEIFGPWCSMFDQNTLYIAGSGKQKLIAYDLTTKKITVPRFLDPFYGKSDVATLLYKDSHGDQWFSCNQGGGLIRKIAHTNTYRQYNRNSKPISIPFGYLITATEDENGNSWFGMIRSGKLLFWDHVNETFTEISPDSTYSKSAEISGGVSFLFADKKGTIWVSYEGFGLVAYSIREKKFKVYTLEEGLPSSYINSITVDDHNRLWMGTQKGLVCFIPGKNQFISFKKESSIPSEEFNTPAIYFDEKLHELWVPSLRSILRINTDKLIAKVRKPIPIYFDDIILNGTPLTDRNKQEFSYQENNFLFQFTAVDLENGKDLEFAYRLDGVDAGWIYAGDKRTAIYSGINSGDHLFIVKAKRKGDTEWVSIGEPFRFHIATPWWKTSWFRALVLLIGGILLWALIRMYYLRKIEQQRNVLEKQQAVEKERTRIATDMHDDFGAGLSRIKFLSEKMQLQDAAGNELDKGLEKISAYSDEMAEKMGEIVWALNTKYDSLGDLMAFCRSYASEYLTGKNIQLYFNDNVIPDMKIHGEVRRNIYLAVKECLHNVVKHSGATALEFIIQKEGDELVFILHDNGRGINHERIRQFANGLKNISKRMIDIHGTALIENDHGTKVVLRIALIYAQEIV